MRVYYVTKIVNNNVVIVCVCMCAAFNRNAKRVRGAHILYNMEWWQQFNLKTKYAVNNKMSTGEVTFLLININ